MQKKDWKVVGLFDADGSSFESEIWGDYNAMAPAIGRNGGCESLTVRLTGPEDAIEAFDKEVRANPRVQLQLDSEPKYYENLAGGTAQALLVLAAFVSHRDGHWRGVWRHEHHVRHRFAAHARDWDAARAGLLALQHPVLVCVGVGAAGALGGVLGCLLAFLTMNGFTTGNRTDQQLQRTGVCVPDHAAGGRGWDGLCGADGICGRTAAGTAGGADADYDGVERGVSGNW